MAEPNPAELAAFMAAVRQHENGGSYAWTEDYRASGHFGAYQIGRREWAAWTAGAGVNPADHSPAAQDRVAAWQMTNYYRQFGTWRAVAVAWYGGPARGAMEARAPGSADAIGSPPIGQYADAIVSAMGRQNAAGGVDVPCPPYVPGPLGLPIPNPLCPGGGTVEVPTSPGDVAEDVGNLADQLRGLARFVAMLTSWDTWRRVLLTVGGAGLVALGLAIATGDLSGVVSIAQSIASEAPS